MTSRSETTSSAFIFTGNPLSLSGNTFLRVAKSYYLPLLVSALNLDSVKSQIQDSKATALTGLSVTTLSEEHGKMICRPQEPQGK